MFQSFDGFNLWEFFFLVFTFSIFVKTRGTVPSREWNRATVEILPATFEILDVFRKQLRFSIAEVFDSGISATLSDAGTLADL